MPHGYKIYCWLPNMWHRLLHKWTTPLLPIGRIIDPLVLYWYNSINRLICWHKKGKAIGLCSICNPAPRDLHEFLQLWKEIVLKTQALYEVPTIIMWNVRLRQRQSSSDRIPCRLSVTFRDLWLMDMWFNFNRSTKFDNPNKATLRP